MYSRKSIERKCLAKGWFTSDPSLIQGAYVFSYLTTLKMMENKKFYFKINPPSLQKKKIECYIRIWLSVSVYRVSIDWPTDRCIDYRHRSPCTTRLRTRVRLCHLSPHPRSFTRTHKRARMCASVFFSSTKKNYLTNSRLYSSARARVRRTLNQPETLE